MERGELGERIRELRAVGFSLRAISERLNVTFGTVTYHVYGRPLRRPPAEREVRCRATTETMREQVETYRARLECGLQLFADEPLPADYVAYLRRSKPAEYRRLMERAG